MRIHLITNNKILKTSLLTHGHNQMIRNLIYLLIKIYVKFIEKIILEAMTLNIPQFNLDV